MPSLLSKEPYLISKEPYLMSKEPYPAFELSVLNPAFGDPETGAGNCGLHDEPRQYPEVGATEATEVGENRFVSGSGANLSAEIGFESRGFQAKAYDQGPLAALASWDGAVSPGDRNNVIMCSTVPPGLPNASAQVMVDVCVCVCVSVYVCVYVCVNVR